MKIDFMNKKQYIKEDKDIKLIIIDPNGKIYLSTISNDGNDMKKTYNLDFYPDNYKCTYHIDYLQVFLNRFLKENKNYKSLIGLINNDKTFNIFDQLLKDGYIVFSNNTSYEGIFYQINGTYGDLYINWPTITKEQESSLSEIEEELSTFNTIDIKKYLDYEKHISDFSRITNNNNSITNILFNNQKRK